MQPTTDKLEKYRQKIDVIDSTIIKLISKRMTIIGRIGKNKRRNDLPVINESRWEQVIRRILKLAKRAELNEEMIEDIWSRMYVESQIIQETKKRK